MNSGKTKEQLLELARLEADKMIKEEGLVSHIWVRNLIRTAFEKAILLDYP
jgi:hypothetical protein